MNFRLECDFLDHPKVLKLVAAHGADGVVGLLRLYAFTAQNRPSGVLAGIGRAELALVMRLPAGQESMCDSLLKFRLLDQRDDGEFEIHAWAERQPFLVDRDKRVERNRENSRRRWNGRSGVKPEAIEDGPATSPKRARPDDLDVWFRDTFQPAYPAHRAHNQVKTALATLRKLKPDAARREQMLSALERWKESGDWLRDGGAFVPGIGNFFVNRLYDTAPPSSNGRNGNREPTAMELVRARMEQNRGQP